jgi:hypothetical protein
MSHTCNPSHSGVKDQEDCCLNLAPGKQFSRPYLEKTHHKKRAVRVAQMVRAPA